MTSALEEPATLQPRHSTRRQVFTVYGIGLAVSLSAALLSLRAGRMGYMPLDQSMIFDGGYRVLDGQLPFRDFVAPAGALPSILQAAFFAVCGTTWFAYCLHAAVVNALFSLLVYGFVRLLGGGSLVSWAWAAFSGVIFYPMVGTPLMDYHAFFFGLAAVVTVLAAGTAGSSLAQLALATAAFPLLAASILSKPTVVPLLVPVLVLAVWRVRRDLRPRLLVGVGVGTAATLAVVSAVILAADIPWDRVVESLWVVPAALGRGRFRVMADRAGELWAAVVQTPLLSPLALLLLAGCLATAHVLRSRRGGQASPFTTFWPDLLLSTGLFVAGLCFAIVTFRPTWNSWGYLFVALGGVYAIAMRHRDARTVAARALTAIVLFSALHDAARVQLAVTGTRLTTLLSPRFVPPPGERVHLPGPLAYLHWATPPYNGYPWQDLAGVVAFFAENRGDFWLMGDSSILYALTGRPSIHPTLWMLPPPGPSATQFRFWANEWEHRLLQSLRGHSVRYVVLEHSLTQMGVSLKMFPCVAAAAQRAPLDRHRFGAFAVIEVPPKAWQSGIECNRLAAESLTSGSVRARG